MSFAPTTVSLEHLAMPVTASLSHYILLYCNSCVVLCCLVLKEFSSISLVGYGGVISVVSVARGPRSPQTNQTKRNNKRNNRVLCCCVVEARIATFS
jgi:hypothetical protein